MLFLYLYFGGIIFVFFVIMIYVICIQQSLSKIDKKLNRIIYTQNKIVYEREGG